MANIEMRGSFAFISFFCACFTVGAVKLRAQDADNHLYDKWQVAASATVVVLSSDVQVNASAGGHSGTVLDAHSDLGLDRSIVQPRLAVRWRPGRRHELELGYQFARPSGDKTLSEDVKFGDTTFALGARIQSSFGSDEAFLVYRFAIIAKERTQVGAGLGFGALLFKPRINALGSGGEVDYSSSADLTGPFVSIGAFARQRLGDRWYLEGDLRGLKAVLGRFTVADLEVNIAGTYYVSTKLGLEGGYALSGIKSDIAPKSGGEKSLSGTIKYYLQSFRLGVVYKL